MDVFVFCNWMFGFVNVLVMMQCVIVKMDDFLIDVEFY